MLVLTTAASTPASSWPRSPPPGPSSWSGSPPPPPALRHLPGRVVPGADQRRDGPHHRRAGHRHLPARYRLGRRYRLATTLLDHRRYPAAALIRLYHERWEHEIAYLALRHTLLQGRVLRSRDPAGLEQEIWALLALYQAIRREMTTPSKPCPAPTPTAPASPTALQAALDTSPARRSCPPTRPSAASAAPSSTACSRPAGPASAPARSSPRSPAGTNPPPDGNPARPAADRNHRPRRPQATTSTRNAGANP